MNDKDRDRSGDGAGPVDHYEKITKNIELRNMIILSAVVFLFSVPVYAQHGNHARLRGLSMIVNVGAMKAGDNCANFYNGAPGNANTLERILYSESYGNSIWNNLTEQDLIASSVSNYNQITVAEYGNMYYKTAIQLGFGFRYDFEQTNWAWRVCFDYAKMNAVGAVQLNSGHNTAYLTNRDAYVTCPTSGSEERIFIDLGLVRHFPVGTNSCVESSLGVNANNTKVSSSDIRIAGVTYSMLDVWGGQSPSSYTGSYPYVNQGGLGYGMYASLSVGFTLPSQAALTLAYTFRYDKIALIGYEQFSPHHTISLNVALNSFSFFDD